VATTGRRTNARDLNARPQPPRYRAQAAARRARIPRTRGFAYTDTPVG